MEKYDYYKDSGIEWLGEIPAHWEMVRNKSFMRPTDEKVGDRKDEFVLLSLTKQGVIVRDLSEGKGKFPKDYDTYLVVRPSNLVFCLFDIDETPRTVGLVKNVGMLTGAYTNFEFFNDLVLPEFAYYYYLKVDDVKGLRPYYTGLRKVVKANTFAQLRMPVPPLAEQKAIVEYLDRETQKINSFIAAKEKELALLDELKQAEIANAIAHGLNPDAPMKSSGISWLGDIPAHWEFARFGYIMKEMFMGRTPEYSMEPNDMLIIGQKNNQKSAFCPDGIKYATENFYSSRPENEFLRNKDIILNTLGGGSVGRVGYFIDTENRRILTDGHLMIIRTDEKTLISKFLFYFLDSKRKELERDASGSTNQVFLTVKGVSKYYSPIPPFEEQQKIVKYLDEKCANIAHLVSNIQSEIDHLKEYKQRLIADAVTGQIKVC